ncbi:MAG: hypothetical protein ACLFVR_15675 [Thiohalospira sp.]
MTNKNKELYKLNVFTEKVLSCAYDYYLDLTDYSDVAWIIVHFDFAKNKDMLKYYKSLNPNNEDVKWLLDNCDFSARNYKTKM